MLNRIKDLREDLDLKQSDLAKATGIDQRTISNYETGKTSPDAYSLVRLADFFNVSIDYLLCRTDIDISGEEKRTKLIQKIKEELADVLCYCILLADRCELDTDEIIRAKIKKNEEKYPIEKAFGNKAKYTELKNDERNK